MSLSIVINTKNSAATLEKTLESVSSLSAEIVIVDMHSSDHTLEIAKRYTDLIFPHEDVGYVEPARNFAINQATGNWIFIIDADEEITPELKQHIQEITTSEDLEGADCFYLPRKNIIFKKWIQKSGWWPDYQLRLFRAGHVSWSDEIHSIPITTGKVTELPAQEELALVHHNYQTIEQFIERMNRYSSIQAQERQDAVLDKNALALFEDEFLRRLFEWKGISEGTHGLALSLLQTFSEVVVYLKQWQQQDFKELHSSQPELTLQALTTLQTDLKYWIADYQVQHTRGLTNYWWRLRRKFRF